MVAARSPPELPTLLGVTVRRSLIVGRIPMAISTAMLCFYSIGFALAPGDLYADIGSLLLPVFAVSGALGGATVFTNDRMKGVLEYLVAYGLTPRRVLGNVLVAGLVQVTVILSVGVAAGVLTHRLAGFAITAKLVEALLLYSFPMSYLTVGLMTTIGVFWTALSSPRAGMTSSVGVLPLIGVAPTTGVLVAALALPGYGVPILFGSEALVGVALLALLSQSTRLMPPERLLSPA